MGEAIDEGVLCDYDLMVPVTTEGHPYICLANLLLSQAGRFRRVLAYCNSIAEAKKFRQVLETVGLAAWHINGKTNRAERERVMNEFARELSKPLHVLVTVQVLGEGVNIPNADTCMFVEPRSSYVSIIQAIGRVLRPHPSKPMAHIVLPAVAMPAMSKTFTMAPPPGSSGLTGSAQHVQPSESEATVTKARRSEPPQNELLASGDGAGDDGCADCRADSSSLMHRAEVGLKGRIEGSNANRPRPCDPSSHRTSTTDDRRGAELGRPDRPAPTIPIARVSDEDAPIAPIGSAASVAAAPAIGDRQVGESVSQHKPASLAQGDDVNSFTAPMPAGTVAAKDGALAACKPQNAGKVKQRKTSWDAAARGRSGVRRDRKDRGCGGGRPTAGLRAQSRRDCYPLSKPLAECSRGENAKKTECSGPSSQSPITDGQQHSRLRRLPASCTSMTPAGIFSEQEPGSSSRELSAAAPTQVAHAGHSTEDPMLMANQGIGAGPSTQEFPAKLIRRRASKLKVKTADDAGLFGSGRADQLDRFLEAIAQADSRFADKDMRILQSRLWVVDCRLQQPTMQHLLARDVQYQLALILQQRDAFDLRVQAVEKFDQEHGRLPRQESSQLEERTLGVWLHNVRYRQKNKMLSAERMQRLLNSSSGRLTARAVKWLEADATFNPLLEELQQFIRKHNRMPDRSKARPTAEQRLMSSLLNLVNPSNRNYERRLQLLEKVGPIAAAWVKLRRARKVRVQMVHWNLQFDRLLEFVEVNKRLPRQRLEAAQFGWLCRQRRQLSYLPAELQAKLSDAHPAIAAFLQS